MCASINVCMYESLYVCLHVCICAFMFVYAVVCMYIGTYECMFVCM